MSAAEPTDLAYFAEIFRGLFSWAARFDIAPSGALSIKSASETIAIDASERIDVGEHAKVVSVAAGTAGAIRTSDTGGKYAIDPGVPGMLAPGLYYLPPGGTVYTPVTMLPAGSTVGGTVPTLPAATPGTAVVLGPGSSKVMVGG